MDAQTLNSFNVIISPDAIDLSTNVGFILDSVAGTNGLTPTTQTEKARMMQTHPYVFKRDGEAVAFLAPDGKFTSNADGAGWYDYDSLADFLADAGVELDPVNYISQTAAVTGTVPEINLDAMKAAAEAEKAAAPTPTPKQTKRGRARAAAEGAPSPVPAPAPVPAPVPVSIPVIPTEAPMGSPLQDPAIQAFIASQRAAAAKYPPVAEDAPQAVPAPSLAPAPVTVPTPPVQLSLTPSATAAAVDALIKQHGIAAVTAAFIEWAETGAATASQYGLTETSKRLRAVAAAHALSAGL